MRGRLAWLLVGLLVVFTTFVILAQPDTPDTNTPTPTLSPTPQTSIVLAQDVFLRGGPGESYLPVGALSAGVQVRGVSRSVDGNWILIPYRRGFGWLRRDLAFWREDIENLPVILENNLTPTFPAGLITATAFFPTPTPRGNYVDITEESALIRAGPGRGYLRLGQLRQGDPVQPLGRNEDTTWILIRFASELILDNPGTTTPEPGILREGFGWLAVELVNWEDFDSLEALPVLSLDNLTPTATFTPSQTATATASPTQTATATLTPTFTATDTATATATETATLTATPTATNSPTATVTDTATATATVTATATATATETATATDTPQPTNTATFEPTTTATDTATATETPTVIATATATDTPQPTSTATATFEPTATATATATATDTPTVTETTTPTATQTTVAALLVTDTLVPSTTPTLEPMATPTATSTLVPSDTPAATETPTLTATTAPTDTPTSTETPLPTATATASATVTNAPLPTDTPAPAIAFEGDTIVRGGPGTGFDVVGQVSAGERTDVIAVNEDGTWLQIRYAGGEGWVLAQLGAVQGDVSGLPVAQVPTDVPTLTETSTVTASATTEITPEVTPAVIVPGTDVPTPTVQPTPTVAPATSPQAAEPDSEGGGLPLELILIGVIVLLVLGYVVLYLRGAAAAERYASGFVIEQCPVCGVGHLTAEARHDRLFGIPRARWSVRCDNCRSVLREVGSRRWRYAVDPLANPALYERYNGQVVDERTLKAMTSSGSHDTGTPPAFVDE